jgi:hypothetical protein
MNTLPFSLRIFLPGADPEGLRIIEKSNWSGSGIVVPRALLPEARKRKELDRTGVYVLVGPAEDSGLPKIYVGEGDPIRPRLDQHAGKKDFWTVAFAFTSKDENLNKAHVQYLEARLLALAAAAKRCTLENGNVPQSPSLSEADAADAEGFLAEMLLCFPVLGVSVFAGPTEPAAQRRTELVLKAKGIVARGAEVPQGFLVLAGSQAVVEEVSSIHAYLSEIRTALRENGVLAPQGDKLVFTQDYSFASPSTAAGVILGRSSNGRTEWKTKEGRTLKDLQTAGVGSEPAGL